MHKRHKRRGWDPFWASLLAALLVLVPLVGGTALLSRQQLRTQLRQTARSESGIPIRLPKADDQLTVLLCVPGEQPSFLLAYLNASQNCVHLLSVPAALTVPFAEGEATLAQCYTAAGPARCREALTETLALPQDTHYLALSPAVLERIAGRYGPVRVSLSGALYVLLYLFGLAFSFYPLVKWCRENEGFSWPWPHVESEKKRIKKLRREQEQEQQSGSEKK